MEVKDTASPLLNFFRSSPPPVFSLCDRTDYSIFTRPSLWTFPTRKNFTGSKPRPWSYFPSCTIPFPRISGACQDLNEVALPPSSLGILHACLALLGKLLLCFPWLFGFPACCPVCLIVCDRVFPYFDVLSPIRRILLPRFCIPVSGKSTHFFLRLDCCLCWLLSDSSPRKVAPLVVV